MSIEFDLDEALRPFSDALKTYLRKNNADGLPEGLIEQVVNHPEACLEKGAISVIQFSLIQAALSFVPQESLKKITRHLENQFLIDQPLGKTVASPERHEWTVREELLNDSFYWHRLKLFWEDTNALPLQVITTNDEDTNDILERLGNPKEPGPWLFRGLVMGSVQSGKTTNYSALIAKAFDVGYGHVVVFAGLTNSLRKQTQERMDQTLVGQNSGFVDSLQHQDFYEIWQYGPDGIRRQPASKTSMKLDFRNTVRQQGNELENTYKEPTLFVIKKNPTVLANLRTYLVNLGGNTKLKKPLLVIDDEADNASINTKKSLADATRINKEIRMLLATAERCSYVGYTATPFANIFIDPNYESDKEMVSDDLFPKHFIKGLEWPKNYVGAHNLFGYDNVKLKEACIQSIEQWEELGPDDRNAHEEILKANHKKEHVFDEIPWALEEAIITFILFCAIQELGDRTHKHSSMLINISRFNLIQHTTKTLADHFFSEMFRAIKSGILKDDWERNPLLARLKKNWDRNDYERISRLDFGQIRTVLTESTKAIEFKIVNMQGGGLVYPEESKDQRGKRFITIGGLALSRGLTLEGLAVSYVVRNIGAQDTLLQTARWFGYRDGYANLCRVFLTDQLIAQFEEAAETIRELREELETMDEAGRTPDDFGLLVRHSDAGLAITARHKMWTAEAIQRAENYQLKQVQVFELLNEAESFDRNEAAVNSFLRDALKKQITVPKHCKPSGEASNAITFTARCLNEVIHLLDAFESPLPNMQSDSEKNQHTMISNYIADRPDELSEWQVVIPFRITNEQTSKSLADNLFDKHPGLEALSDVMRNVQLKNGKKTSAKARTKSTLRVQKGAKQRSRLIFDNRNVSDSPKSDLVHSFDEDIIKQKIQKLNFFELRKENKTVSGEILKLAPRPILLIQVYDPFANENDEKTKDKGNKPPRIKSIQDIKLGSSQLLTTLSLAFPKTEKPAKPRKYYANTRYQEFWEQDLIEELDDIDEDMML